MFRFSRETGSIVGWSRWWRERERETQRQRETEKQRGTERLIMRALAHAIMEAGKFTFTVWTS